MTAPTPPDGTVLVPGGLVVVGPYQDDPGALGRREVFLPDYFLDRAPPPAFDAAACAASGGRPPTAAELEHALRRGLVQPAALPERTSTLIPAADAQALAALEGVGCWEVLLAGISRMRLALPGSSPQSPARGRWDARATPPSRVARTLRLPAEVRRGRGEAWPVVVRPAGLGPAPRLAPLALAANQIVYVEHEDAAWCFVATAPLAEPVGWIPAAHLAPRAA